MRGEDPLEAFDPFAAIDRAVSGVDVVSPDISRTVLQLQRAAGATGLCEQIARSLVPRAGASVLLVTGFVVPELIPQGENDGPLGTIALARALASCGLIVRILVDPPLADTIRWLASEASVEPPIYELSPTNLSSWVDGTDMAIAIEKPAANERGVLHTFDGRRIDGGSVPVDSLFAELNRAGCLTVGIGDRGNEIGFGSVRNPILQLTPQASRCTCPCEGTIVSATPTTYVYPSAVSNWGAYGLVAACAILMKRPEILVQANEERRWLRVAAVRGCQDGVERRGLYGVDGVHGDDSARVVTQLAELARVAIGTGSS